MGLRGPGNVMCEDHDLPWALVSQAQDAVRDQLKASSTAKFPLGRRQVQAVAWLHVRPGRHRRLAERLRAMLRSTWTAHAQPNGSKWDVIVKSIE
jgi:hypothetical protein